MVNTKNRGILENIQNHCKRIETIKSGLKKEEYDKNENFKELFCFHILQIGELVKHFDDEFVKSYSKVPWGDIAGMRDIVAHGYGTIKTEEVWKVVNNDIPELIQYCNQILNENK